MPKISVVLPSFNHERFIGDAIRSVLGQSFDDFELIVVDDASIDDSASIIRGFSDPRCRMVIQPENRGAPATMNEGLRQAGGEFVAFLGSDDKMAPNRLARQLEAFVAQPALGAVFSWVEAIDETDAPHPDQTSTPAGNNRQPNRSRQQHLAYMFEHGCCLCQPSALVRRECFQRLGLLDERLANSHDFDFWLRLLLRYEILILPECLTYYRWLRSGANLSAPNSGRLSRIFWETSHLLNHYLTLDWQDLAQVFGENLVSQYRSSGAPPELLTIDVAASHRRPEYQLFALNALYARLSPYGGSGPLYRHLARMAEQCDPLRLKLCMAIQQSAGKPSP